MHLVWPSAEHLESHVAALQTGWSADNLRGAVMAREELDKIDKDAAEFLRNLVDREAKAGPVTLPDGSIVPRIPGYQRWLWDGEFCGSINFRWQPGTAALPPHCLGHIGYAVVPWKQRRGYATLALGQLLPDAKAQGLPFVEITTDPTNIASQRVILANGGVLVERFIKPAAIWQHRRPAISHFTSVNAPDRSTHDLEARTPHARTRLLDRRRLSFSRPDRREGRLHPAQPWKEDAAA